MVEEVRRLVKLKLHLPRSLPHTSPQVLHLYLLTTSQTTHCTSVYAERSPFGLPLEPFCHPLACFMISQGPPMWTASAYLAPSPSRIQPKESTCRSLAGRKTKMAGCVFPTSCLPAWPHIFSRCSLSCDFSCWMLPQTTSHSRNSSVLAAPGPVVWQLPTAAPHCCLWGPCAALFPSCCTPLWRVPSLCSHWNSS